MVVPAAKRPVGDREVGHDDQADEEDADVVDEEEALLPGSGHGDSPVREATRTSEKPMPIRHRTAKAKNAIRMPARNSS